MSRKRRKKDRDQRRHGIERLAQRFGLGQRDYEEIIKLIQGGKTTVVDKQSNRVVVHKLKYNGVEMWAVYDRIRKQCITFLHEHMDKTVVVEE